jgi:hypothetical protein
MATVPVPAGMAATMAPPCAGVYLEELGHASLLG